MKSKILIVEDNLLLSGLLCKWLREAGYEVIAVSNEPAARKAVWKVHPDLILSDVRLPEGNGIQLLEWLGKEEYGIPFIIMTEYASYPDAVRAIQKGASDYLPKPIYREPLLELLHEKLKSPVSVRRDRPVLERKSAGAKQVERLVHKVAPSELSVLISGANGSGKELVAQTIHRLSHRHDAPFVAVNCGGMPRELAASEFFGHVKGAFTGADADVPGYFSMARRGTLFLDEVGNMPPDLQTLLLRVLQERTYTPVGSRKIQDADVRIIAATNENLLQAIREGRFREDLYHRLSEFEIHQPALVECPEDILPLAEFFRERTSAELKRMTKGFTEHAEKVLLAYNWPGNVRELSNRVKRAVLLADSMYVSDEDLGLRSSPYNLKGNIATQSKETEKEQVKKALDTANGNITLAAKILGVSRRTFYIKMDKYGLR